ncbi:MAG: chlorophyll a/b-binding protein [Nodosilinea sp.]
MTSESEPVNPQPVAEPGSDDHEPQPSFGWTAYAERLNGRFAMVGFVALLLLELWSHQDFFTWLGLR